MGKLRNKTFQRMFLSYVTMIVLCFCAYSAVVIHETAVLKREKAVQYYEQKSSEILHEIDSQIVTAQSILANINGMASMNQLYHSVKLGDSVDSYVLYQVMQDIRGQKTGAGTQEIYSVVCLLDGYDRVYTSEGVIRLEYPFMLNDKKGSYLSEGSLNQLTGQNSSDLTFTKDFLIYVDDYRYRSGTPRGRICVLFDRSRFSRIVASYLEEGDGWKISFDGKTLLEGGKQETSRQIRAVSVIDSRMSLEILEDRSRFRLEPASILSLAMCMGVAVSILFVGLALFYANRFYAPIERIWKMIGKDRDEQDDGFQELAAGVENLMAERDGYRNEVLTISPYAETGMIHSLLSGEMDAGKLGRLYRKDILSPENMFFIVAVINLYYEGKDKAVGERMRQAKEIIRACVKNQGKQQREKDRYICFERDAADLYLVINTDHGEDAEETIYQFYQNISKSLGNEDFSVTIGVDEIKEQIGDLPRSCQNAVTALNRILLEGRGGVYFYEENDSNAYYFPKEVTRQLAENLSEERLDCLKGFLDDLKQKNMVELDISNRGIELLLDDLYVSTVKAVWRVNSTFGLGIHVEKLPPYLTFDEVEEYYCHVYEIVIDEVRANRPEEIEPGAHDREIIAYVDQNFSDPNISLTAIGEHFKVSTKYITMLFKQTTGITYLQYVQERRIALAVHELRHTDASFEEIARRSGYSNMLTFRRNFKSIMGMNPSDFPRQP